MPQYHVTDPASGRRITLTGDAPPTEAELTQIFSAIEHQEEGPLTRIGHALTGAHDTAAAAARESTGTRVLKAPVRIGQGIVDSLSVLPSIAKSVVTQGPKLAEDIATNLASGGERAKSTLSGFLEGGGLKPDYSDPRAGFWGSLPIVRQLTEHPETVLPVATGTAEQAPEHRGGRVLGDIAQLLYGPKGVKAATGAVKARVAASAAAKAAKVAESRAVVTALAGDVPHETVAAGLGLPSAPRVSASPVTTTGVRPSGTVEVPTRTAQISPATTATAEGGSVPEPVRPTGPLPPGYGYTGMRIPSGPIVGGPPPGVTGTISARPVTPPPGARLVKTPPKPATLEDAVRDAVEEATTPAPPRAVSLPTQPTTPRVSYPQLKRTKAEQAAINGKHQAEAAAEQPGRTKPPGTEPAYVGTERRTKSRIASADEDAKYQAMREAVEQKNVEARAALEAEKAAREAGEAGAVAGQAPPSLPPADAVPPSPPATRAGVPRITGATADDWVRYHAASQKAPVASEKLRGFIKQNYAGREVSLDQLAKDLRDEFGSERAARMLGTTREDILRRAPGPSRTPRVAVRAQEAAEGKAAIEGAEGKDIAPTPATPETMPASSTAAPPEKVRAAAPSNAQIPTEPAGNIPTAADLVVKRRSKFGSNKWGVFNTKTGKFVELAQRTPEGGMTRREALFSSAKKAEDAIGRHAKFEEAQAAKKAAAPPPPPPRLVKTKKNGEAGFAKAAPLIGAGVGATVLPMLSSDKSTDKQRLAQFLTGGVIGGGIGAAVTAPVATAEALLRARINSMLSGMAVPKNIANYVGAAATAAAEGKTMHPYLRSPLAPMKELARIPTNVRTFRDAMRQGSSVAPYAMSQGTAKPPIMAKVIGALDETAKEAFGRAGVSGERAFDPLIDADRSAIERLLLSAPNDLKNVVGPIAEGTAGRIMFPFQRVPANVVREGMGELNALRPGSSGGGPLSRRAMVTYGSAGAGELLGRWVAEKNPKRRALLATLLISALGPRTMIGTIAGMHGAGGYGRSYLGGVSPIPEFAFDPRTNTGATPAGYKVWKKLFGAEE